MDKTRIMFAYYTPTFFTQLYNIVYIAAFVYTSHEMGYTK